MVFVTPKVQYLKILKASANIKILYIFTCRKYHTCFLWIFNMSTHIFIIINIKLSTLSKKRFCLFLVSFKIQLITFHTFGSIYFFLNNFTFLSFLFLLINFDICELHNKNNIVLQDIGEIFHFSNDYFSSYLFSFFVALTKNTYLPRLKKGNGEKWE